jgi:hypothetical protein
MQVLEEPMVRVGLAMAIHSGLMNGARFPALRDLLLLLL